MKLADGFRWSRSRLRIEVYVRGKLVAWQGITEAKHLCNRGGFRYLVALKLVEYGWSLEDAHHFCQQLIRNRLDWMAAQEVA